MDIEDYREEFPVASERIFLDHAKVAPLPKRVRGVVGSFLKDASEAGTLNYDSWMLEVERVRTRFADLINALPDEVAFIKNTSEGISIVANGLDWREGDNVVIPDIEFPSNVYPWLNLKRLGVDTRFVKAVDGRVVFDDLKAAVDSRTRIVSVSSVECNTGFRNNLAQIGAFCRERGVLFCVDAIQSLGALPMDVNRDPIDFLAADGHKWMLSVEGLGGFYVSRNAMNQIHPAVVGWDSVINARDYMNYDFTLRPDAKRFEEGSFNTMSIHAFGAALSLLLEVGLDRIQAKIMKLGDGILERLRRRGWKIINSTLYAERSGIVSFSLDTDLGKLAPYLKERKIDLTARDGLVRLSPHFYNTEEEIDRCFEALDEFTGEPPEAMG